MTIRERRITSCAWPTPTCVCVREPTDCVDGLCMLVKSTCTCIYMYMHMDLYTHVCIQIHISKAPRLAQLPCSASPSLRGRHQFWRQNPRQCLAWYRQKKSDSEWRIDQAYIRRTSGVYQAYIRRIPGKDGRNV